MAIIMAEVLNVKEVGKMLRISGRTVARLAESGEIPAFKVGGQWRFQQSEVEAYIEEQKKKYRHKD